MVISINKLCPYSTNKFHKGAGGLGQTASSCGDDVKFNHTNDSIAVYSFALEPEKLQPRGTRGESKGGDTGVYDISNVHRLGYTEVELIKTMIKGVNKLIKEDNKLLSKK